MNPDPIALHITLTAEQYAGLQCALVNYMRRDWALRRHASARERIRRTIQTLRILDLYQHNLGLPRAQRIRTIRDLRAWRTMVPRRSRQLAA